MQSLEKWALSRGYIPALRFTELQAEPEQQPDHPNAAADKPEVQPCRDVSPDKLPEICDRVYHALANYGNKISPVDELFKAALYTLLRPAEYCVLEWNWIDFYSKTITIPAPYLKEKREFTLPISRHFLRILCQRHSVFVRYVIACANKGKNPSPVSFKKFLKKPRSRWVFPSDQNIKTCPLTA